MHLTPETEITTGLQEVGVINLGILANQLAAAGPVLMAGDMNFHYRPIQYPRDLLTSYGFTPTYDVTGTSFATGDHRGATIDYVFLKEASQFTAVLGQYNQELYSDHDAVTADLAFTDAPLAVRVSSTPGTFTNAPEGTRGARRAMLDLMVKAVDNAPAGAAIHLTTAKLGDKPLYRALRAAIERKVHVQVVTRRNHPTQQELNLMNVLGARSGRRTGPSAATTSAAPSRAGATCPRPGSWSASPASPRRSGSTRTRRWCSPPARRSPRRGSGSARRRTTARSSGSSCWSAGRSESAQSEPASGWVTRLETR